MLLLGSISPFVVRLEGRLPSLGVTAGRVFALSTAGSLGGTFLAAFWLIPTYGCCATLRILVAALVIPAIGDGFSVASAGAGGPYAPVYCLTQEFFQAVHRRLSPAGVVALNVFAPGGDDELSEAVAATMASVFASVFEIPLDEERVLFAFRELVEPGQIRAWLAGGSSRTISRRWCG